MGKGKGRATPVDLAHEELGAVVGVQLLTEEESLAIFLGPVTCLQLTKH